jgi:hypothetical protein
LALKCSSEETVFADMRAPCAGLLYQKTRFRGENGSSYRSVSHYIL